MNLLHNLGTRSVKLPSATVIAAIIHRILAMELAAKSFFSSPRFAVAGASQDVQKYGYKGLI